MAKAKGLTYATKFDWYPLVSYYPIFIVKTTVVQKLGLQIAINHRLYFYEEIGLTLMKISYRAISAPSSLVRRLGYLSQILRFAKARPLNKDVLAIKLRDWSYTHTNDLENYKYKTGAAHSVEKKRMTQLAVNYLDLAVKFGLLSQISHVYQLTRIGRVLLSLVDDKPNEKSNLFFLHEDERIFYIYQILQQDADFLLTVINMVQLLENPDHKNLQKNFHQFFLERLGTKILTSSQEHITKRLYDRQIEVTTEWKKPESYAAYAIPPRLHWLLDLGLLRSTIEKNNFIYEFTETGQNLIKNLPKLAKSHILDVPDSWFNTHFFSEVGPLIIPDADFRQWRDIDDKVRQEACEKYLSTAFSKFQRSRVPKISLTQGMIYLCICFVTRLHLLINVQELIQWFQKPRKLGNYKYEVRTSARENEAYFIRFHI